MIPGPDIIIKCPYCSKHAKRRTLSSGNTFGASLWSDGKQVARMLPEYPRLLVCKKCNQFYWVKDAVEVDSIIRYNPVGKPKRKWTKIPYITFPTFQDYQRSLESGFIRNKIDEKYVRIQLWWQFNDNIRGKYSLINLYPNAFSNFNSLNIEELFQLLDDNETSEILMKAEILRNLGKFDESRLMLESITDEDYTWIKNKFFKAIVMKNKELFRLR